MTSYDRRSIALAIALSSLAGYVDATGFLLTGGFFVSFMSGNSTRLGIGLGTARLTFAAIAIGIIALFVAGVIFGTIVGHQAKAKRKARVLALVASLLVVASLSRTLGIPHLGTAAMILAMGAENATFQRDGETTIGLTYMTGTLVKVGQRLAAAIQGGPKWNWVPYAMLWLGMATGAAGGALAFNYLNKESLWPAAIGAIILAVISLRVPHEA